MSVLWLCSDGRQPNGKPPHSYAELIAFAIKSVKEIPQRMTLADIYKYIMDKFPYSWPGLDFDHSRMTHPCRNTPCTMPFLV